MYVPNYLLLSTYLAWDMQIAKSEMKKVYMLVSLDRPSVYYNSLILLLMYKTFFEFDAMGTKGSAMLNLKV